MIRKFFVATVISIVAPMVASFLIAQAFLLSYLNQEVWTQQIIPESFEPVLRITASHTAETSHDKDLFYERLKTALSREDYIDSMKSAFFAIQKNARLLGEGNLTLDFTEVKEHVTGRIGAALARLPTCDERDQGATSFRFCTPSSLKSLAQQAEITQIIEKEFPSKINLAGSESSSGYEFGVFVRLMGSSVSVMWYSIFVTLVIGLGLVALIAYRPLDAILGAVGAYMLSITLITALLLFALYEIPLVLNALPQFLPAYSELADVLTRQPRTYLAYWTAAFFIITILAYTGRFLVRRNKTL